MFRLNEQFDAAGDARVTPDRPATFQCEHHLMGGGRSNVEVALDVGLGGRAAEDAAIGMDEGQILALLGGEG